MSFAGRTAPAKSGGLSCSVGQLLARLDAGEAEALQAMLDDDAWSSPAIHEVIKAEGHHDVARTTVGHHRRHDCRCCRDNRCCDDISRDRHDSGRRCHHPHRYRRHFPLHHVR